MSERVIALIAATALLSGCYVTPGANHSGWFMDSQGVTSYRGYTSPTGQTSGFIMGPSGVSTYNFGSY